MEAMETGRGRERHQWTRGNRKRKGGKRQVETLIDQRTCWGGGGRGRPGETGRGRERLGEMLGIAAPLVCSCPCSDPLEPRLLYLSSSCGMLECTADPAVLEASPAVWAN